MLLRKNVVPLFHCSTWSIYCIELHTLYCYNDIIESRGEEALALFYFTDRKVEGLAVLKPCPRCKRFIPSGWYYCPDCKPIVEAEKEEAKARKEAYRKAKYNKAYNQRRDPKYTKFYTSKAWKATSKAKLRAVEWKCEGHLHENCTGLACEVHHIKPIQTPEGWDKRLDWDNLEALCTVCHNVRHPEKLKRRHDDGVIDLRKIIR